MNTFSKLFTVGLIIANQTVGLVYTMDHNVGAGNNRPILPLLSDDNFESAKRFVKRLSYKDVALKPFVPQHKSKKALEEDCQILSKTNETLVAVLESQEKQFLRVLNHAKQQHKEELERSQQQHLLILKRNQEQHLLILEHDQQLSAQNTKRRRLLESVDVQIQDNKQILDENMYLTTQNTVLKDMLGSHEEKYLANDFMWAENVTLARQNTTLQATAKQYKTRLSQLEKSLADNQEAMLSLREMFNDLSK